MKVIADKHQLAAVSGGNVFVASAAVAVGALIIGPMWGVGTAYCLKTTCPSLNPGIFAGAVFAAAISTSTLGASALTGLYFSVRELVYYAYGQCPA